MAGDSTRTQDVTRTHRYFFGWAATALYGIAVPGLLLFSPARAQAPPECKPAPCLSEIGEITSDTVRAIRDHKTPPKKGTLKAVMKVKNEGRMVPGGPKMMRYFEGYDATNGFDPKGKTPWPATHGVPAPGPTLRARVGDTVNIMFLNQIDVGVFGDSIDRLERGISKSFCDEASNAAISDPHWYPVTARDKSPNCFHGSSTTNIHFHGTHVTPNGLGDNVLLQIRPDPASATENRWRTAFEKIFNEKTCPATWDDVPKDYWRDQKELLSQHDKSALPADETEINAGLWPQYFIGAYPYCFKITEKAGHEAAQVPGTQWYHAHKHGSTTVNMLNGLSGVFIIEGKYDDDLKKIYPTLRQKVLVLQQLDDTPNLERAMHSNNSPPGPPSIFVNGQVNPTIEMRPGEIQLWRIVNATVQPTIRGSFDKPDLDFRQIAQDGVQFKWVNFEGQPFTPAPKPREMRKFSLAPGGRIDLLVKVPDQAKSGDIYKLSPLLTISVAGDQARMDFPDRDHYPEFPDHLPDDSLKDIPAPPPPQPHRTLKFGWEKGRKVQGRDNKTNAAPEFMIDDQKFKDKTYQQTMCLGQVEDWKITNTTSLTHPFHIHVNPFQVIEIYDPNQKTIYKPGKDFVWHDVINIPAALMAEGKVILDETTKEAKTPGYVIIRQHFVDFPGSFVLHCHILAHEDRGMMQLVRVVDKNDPAVDFKTCTVKDNNAIYGHH